MRRRLFGICALLLRCSALPPCRPLRRDGSQTHEAASARQGVEDALHRAYAPGGVRRTFEDALGFEDGANSTHVSHPPEPVRRGAQVASIFGVLLVICLLKFGWTCAADQAKVKLNGEPIYRRRL
ncbi:hypothetical protein M885DRAFT_558559 [Pelagophyceae sp. CCMP2097]|nr:hypothetical protein M885DRAFT_558559 [Pelagophyceae sp. CCMP2097]